ncbi:MAG: helix-turn-helix transcriptional regulator [Acidobacteriota bacterium]|jgi:PadR family transcriptional regulator PadR
MNNLNRELRRGSIELIILKLLENQEMYGYQLVSIIEERAGGLFEVAEGTLYPVLYRLEDRGSIESYRDNPKRGVPRKYYRLTKRGKAYLQDLLEEWKKFSAIMQSLLKEEEVVK